MTHELKYTFATYTKRCNLRAEDAAYWHREAVRHVRHGQFEQAAFVQSFARIASAHSMAMRLNIINRAEGAGK